MAGPALMTNLARGAKIVALLLFLLPWVTISCAEQTLASMSGVDLATGSVTLNNPNPPGSTGGPAPDNPFDQPNMAVIAAALLILLGLIAGFLLKGRTGLMAGAACAAAAAAAVAYAVFVDIPTTLRASQGFREAMDDPQMAGLIKMNVEIGAWLVLLALAAAVVLAVLAMKGGAAAPTASAEPPA